MTSKHREMGCRKKAQNTRKTIGTISQGKYDGDKLSWSDAFRQRPECEDKAATRNQLIALAEAPAGILF
jgi:hypothetical protein